MDYDQYLADQVEKHMTEGLGELSNCCGADIYEDSDICTECNEHCVTMDEEKEIAMWDKADSKMEERRERND